MASQRSLFPAEAMRLQCPHFLANRTILFLGSMILTLIVASGSQAAEWDRLEIGHRGVSKVSCWVPVSARASELPPDTAVQLTCEFSSPRGDRFVQTVGTSTTDGLGQVSLSGYCLIGRQEGTGQVSIRKGSEDTILLRQTIAHSEDVSLDSRPEVATDLRVHRLDVPFLLTYGELAGIPELLRNAKQFSAGQQLLEGITFPSIQDLPEDARGYDGIQLLLLTDDFDCNKAQANAIRQWVLTGGSLFVSAGSSVESLTSNSHLGWLTKLLDIRPEPFSVRDLSPLQSYVAAADPGVTALRTRRERDGIRMAEFGSEETVIQVPSLNGPILGRQSFGSGVIQFLAVDVNQKPLSQWNSLPQFYEVLLLGGKLSARTTAQSRTARISQSGVSDLGSQLMSVVDNSSGDSQWSTWAVMGVVAIYLLLIGPLDYVLVTLLLKKPSLTWITFPCWVTAGALALFALTATDVPFQSNHLNIVDVMPHADGEAVNLRSWVSLRPRETMLVDVTAVVDESIAPSQDRPVSLRWAGRPEDVFGGMYRVGGVGLGQRSYAQDQSQPQSLSTVPMLVDGSREVKIESFHDSSDGLVQSQLQVSGAGLLDGEFTNNLPFDISDWIMVYGNRVYRPRGKREDARITAKSTFDARSGRLYASDLKSFLNASRLVLDESKNNSSYRGATQVSTPYDKESTDPMYILTMASFYQRSGGPKYVGLGNSLLGDLEASDSVRLNHAVLIGMADVPATSIEVAGIENPKIDSRTIVRLFLPVKRRPVRDEEKSSAENTTSTSTEPDRD